MSERTFRRMSDWIQTPIHFDRRNEVVSSNILENFFYDFCWEIADHGNFSVIKEIKFHMKLNQLFQCKNTIIVERVKFKLAFLYLSSIIFLNLISDLLD